MTLLQSMLDDVQGLIKTIESMQEPLSMDDADMLKGDAESVERWADSLWDAAWEHHNDPKRA